MSWCARSSWGRRGRCGRTSGGASPTLHVRKSRRGGASPTLRVRGRRRAKRLPDVLTADELEAVLAVPNKGCVTGLRDATILRLMGKAGLRVAEVCGLKLSDVHIGDGRPWFTDNFCVAEVNRRRMRNSCEAVITGQMDIFGPYAASLQKYYFPHHSIRLTSVFDTG